MRKFRVITILALVLGLTILNVQTVFAFPPLPSSFYGTVKFNGANVPAGTIVSAKINGIQYASTIVSIYLGDTVYSLDVPGDQSDTPGIIEGGGEGDTVVFFIGSAQASQTGTWHSGANVNLNLTGNSGPKNFRVYLPLVIR